MKTVSNRTLIDHMVFLQTIYNMNKVKLHPTETEEKLLAQIEEELSKYVELIKSNII